jgi:hypothetical protein
MVVLHGMEKRHNPKAVISDLLINGYSFEFKAIFKVWHYHKTRVCRDGIGYSRLTTIVNDPGKMTVWELLLIARHFEVPKEAIFKTIIHQLDGLGIAAFILPDGTVR